MTRLPRFDVAAGLLARGGADQLVRPLSPTLGRLVEDTDEAKAHAGVSARYGESRTKVAGLREALIKAKEKDEAGERAALGRGTKPPRPQAFRLEDQLAEEERQLGLLDGLVVEYAHALLRRAVERLPEALAQAEGSLDSALADVRDTIDKAAAIIESANEAAAELGWLRTLADQGHVYVFTGGKKARVLPSVSEALVRAQAGFDYDLQQRAEWREEVERQREAEDQKPLAPGTNVWMNGRSYVVGPSGEFQEVEEAGR